MLVKIKELKFKIIKIKNKIELVFRLYIKKIYIIIMSSESDFFMVTGLFCIVFTMFGLVLSLPIVEIYYGVSYQNQIICQSSINIEIPLWLILKGSIKLLSIIFISIYHFSTSKSICGTISSFIFSLLQTFLFVWLILGSIIFWRDCPNIEPTSVNTLMWFSLILEMFFILGSRKSLERHNS